ncbi:MAG: hypothetical protein AMXMBFR20_01380 [Planctomycetia bacterium]
MKMIRKRVARAADAFGEGLLGGDEVVSHELALLGGDDRRAIPPWRPHRKEEGDEQGQADDEACGDERAAFR